MRWQITDKRLYWLFLANLILCLPGLWVPYYNIDEITNALYAKFILAGDLSLSDFVGNTYFLTHYLYVALGKLFGFSTLIPIHVFHAFWKCGTTLALYWAGKEMAGAKAGFWAALFYTVCSPCYMSKDFHTPIAESFSLLPAVIAAAFLFRGINKRHWVFYFWCGVFTALATLFKTPMGVLLVAIYAVILVRKRGFLLHVSAVSIGFFGVFLVPILLISPFGDGFRLLTEKIAETNSVYIQSYDGISFLYWILKFLLRTFMVLGAMLGMTLFAIYPYKTLFSWRKRHRDYWQKTFFLVLWATLLWLTVTIGKRIFYHYYVFLLAPLPLLAAAGLVTFDRRLKAVKGHARLRDRGDDKEERTFLTFVRKHLAWVLGVPLLVFSLEGAFNFSTVPPKLDEIIAYVKANTQPSDRIYVWGDLPQIYFYADRQPATTSFWSEYFSGSSPGSPAMEYIRATGKSLALSERMIKDLQASVFKRKRIGTLLPETTLFEIQENELFTLAELLEKIENKHWQKVFTDFFVHPPVLFVDTSPTNLRGFGHYPIYRYELMKRFVLDNYTFAGKVNGMYVYRLKLALNH